MKISVISSYSYIRHYNNYGALFQYYALQKYLEKRGHYVEWIRTESSSISKRGILRLFYSYFRHPFMLVHDIKVNLCHIKFMLFVKNHLYTTKKDYKNILELTNTPPTADFYITGSDQVWSGCSPKNYLTFVHDSNKKIAYAASFGEDYIAKEKEDVIKPWLQAFEAISVREDTGVEICKSMGIKAVHLVDPTLLISSEDYLTTEQSKFKKQHYFGYFLNINNRSDIWYDDLQRYVHAENAELKVTAIQGAEKCIDKDILIYPSPKEWVGYIRSSEGIFTNSFHGTLFAILFHKPFIVFLQTGNSAKQNGRIRSLLKMFALSDRLYDGTTTIDAVIKRPINWEEIEIIKAKWLEKTNEFFKKIGL